MLNHEYKAFHIDFWAAYDQACGASGFALSPFSTRRICSRDAKRKQESGNVIG